MCGGAGVGGEGISPSRAPKFTTASGGPAHGAGRGAGTHSRGWMLPSLPFYPLDTHLLPRIPHKAKPRARAAHFLTPRLGLVPSA